MPKSPMSEVVQHLRRAVLARDGAGFTNGQLLERFITRRDEAALAALVRRHGPMVWGVCRRVLHNTHDAEDAFQATFLVLVRKAASVVPSEMVVNWLYGVAHQTALKARAMIAKRKGRERQVADMPEPFIFENDRWRELEPLLDQELSRLPDKYRAVLCLCDLEGNTRKEAARQLGCPEGTVAGRLARARVLLAKRLTQRGIAVSAGSLAALLTHHAASANVPASLLSSAIKAATIVAAGQTAASSLVSAHVIALMEGVVRAMLLTKLQTTILVVLTVIGALVFGGGWLAYSTAAERPVPAESKQSAAAEAGARPADSDGSVGYLLLRHEDYKAFFLKTLGVVADYFEIIQGANQYDGRIEAMSPFRGQQPPMMRKASAQITIRDDGAFSVWVQINKIIDVEANRKPVARDKELEKKILQRLNATQDWTRLQWPLTASAKTTAVSREEKMPSATASSLPEPACKFAVTARGNRLALQSVLPPGGSAPKRLQAMAECMSNDQGEGLLTLEGNVDCHFEYPDRAPLEIRGLRVLYSTKTGRLQASGPATK